MILRDQRILSKEILVLVISVATHRIQAVRSSAYAGKAALTVIFFVSQRATPA
jgi:hypothetical protein